MKNVQRLIKNGKAKMLLNGRSIQDITTPKILKGGHQKDKLIYRTRAAHQNDSLGSGPGLQMMGNIGLTK